MVANRQNQRVYAALDAVLPRLDPIEDFDSPHPGPNSVVVTQDRWGLKQHVALGKWQIEYSEILDYRLIQKFHKRAET